MALHKRVERTRRGDFRVRLPAHERALLRSLRDELRTLLHSDDPALERLFPPAYGEDVDRNAEWRALVRGDLLSGRLSSLDIMEATMEADRLDEEQLVAWLGSLNDLRLVLGTRLEVTEEDYERDVPDEDPRRPAFAVYHYLSWLEEELVEALGSGLPAEGSSRE